MKNIFTLGCIFMVIMGFAALAMADMVTTSSCNVSFSVNESNAFYVRGSQIVPAVSPPGLEATATITGSYFALSANSAGYSDSGIVLYFNGGLKLGDLKSVSVVSTGSPVSINLWLDTGGDGSFFAFDANGMMTGLNGDSYGGHGGASLDATSSIQMFGGNGAGHTYTLAQLQSGTVPGIDRNTRAALWIGITNNNTADISSIAVGIDEEGAALLAGGNRLAAMQNADGGWGWPLSGASAQNTIAPIAMGLAKAYSHTGSADQLAALEKAGIFLLAKTNTFATPDGYLAAELDSIFGGNTYRNHVKTNFYDQLAAGTYNRNGAGTLYNTATYLTLIRNNRASQGIPNLAAWDLGMGLVAASSCGADTSEWIAGVKSEINELDGNLQYDVNGLAGAVYGLAFVNEDFDPTAGEHEAASSLNDLAAVLAGYQINNGGFADNKNNVAPGHESVQETDYAILALNEVNRAVYLNNIQGASDFLIGLQMLTGGWNGDFETGALENNEETGESLWGISTAIAPSYLAGGDRLAAMQNTDGGWGWPLTGSSQQNTIGPVAMGLAKAYSNTGSAAQLAALQKAGAFLLAKTNTFSPPDGYLAAELDKVFGGNTYSNHLKTYFYGPLAAGTYNRNGAGTFYDTAGYITYIRNNRVSQGIPNLAAWDLGMGLVAAASCGADINAWIAGVKDAINELDGNAQYDVIGLAGAVYGLAFVHEEFDPTAGEHAAASSLNDLAAILAGYQINNGGFAESKNYVVPGHEGLQETSYAMLALNEVNRAAFLGNIHGASGYLAAVQLLTGGWGGDSGGTPDENNEVTGEVLWGLSTLIAPPYCSPLTITASSGANGTIDPSGTVSVDYGADQSFTITPGTNYHVADVLVDGSSEGAVTGYTFNTVTTSHTISATFAVNTHTVSPSAGENGTIDPSTSQTVNHNATASFTVTPSPGYHAVISGSCGGTLVGSTYTTNPVTADCTVDANFAIDTHTVTPVSGANGTIDPSTPQTVNHNATIPFTVTPAPNYRAIMSGTCGGTLVGSIYTTNPVTADCSVSASFAPIAITAGYLPSGTVLLPYDATTLTVTNGVPPYSWSVVDGQGTLPDGLTFSSSTGQISGTPLAPGTFSFRVHVTDAGGLTAERDLTITTIELPIRYGSSGTPVNPDTIIQGAYNQCVDGGVIQMRDLEFSEDLVFDLPVTVTLQGGYCEGFTDNSSFTTITGKLVIAQGTVIIDRIVIK
jgi:hypothetical protein